ncbi:MAG: hypothetical protein IKH16_02545, partial [Selenomonadaceae bacterium]|nr:hypothetical protein [Selenomonadaceae bacterium]
VYCDVLAFLFAEDEFEEHIVHRVVAFHLHPSTISLVLLYTTRSIFPIAYMKNTRTVGGSGISSCT